MAMLLLRAGSSLQSVSKTWGKSRVKNEMTNKAKDETRGETKGKTRGKMKRFRWWIGQCALTLVVACDGDVVV